ncbi:MAG: hypothetical protein IPP15_13800 [Saprospiraceae bacterium]|uniref:Uncharacterized protein n=1 Tax=Candidatus Opimibacter skivensis TaxID=2982028 RepID=A0A9D7SWX4_9BACT|nr:hypothetical protein [Candidatus Opimibacter skivensis]
MKKLMYLGLWLMATGISSVSCLKNEPIQDDEILERKIIYSTDTIVILDPEIGNEIKKVIEKTDTVWILQNEK